ncbi:asparagine synthase (glutamine-hydrolyzing) [Prochlorococcus marinus]|uniref:asparagine synthase (glutamine-hydrolyzing) n=1 Tax=Prochlorococcus marinus TaxID=1219 RepID=UPI001ADB450C|nr:asparagine synthase (glutamine-hydrolyzing) [Prochlorococcus marinus]MBO8204950.1 asparagine synthase (glutamine-hydrolyzing) [Prochlorococcus marinus CUG1415]MBW3044222.1 asparagine synthase (glutamine-hydrolyzing) [Prochlorococcus marinus str. MU1415]
MCGILFLNSSQNLNSPEKSKFKRSIKLLDHRGPDNNDIFFTEKFALGHTRLSIIDLSNKSNQPFFSKNDKKYFAINGEIINYKILANKYNYNDEDYGSDSDLVFKLFTKYGFKNIINELEGMFAGIFIDCNKNESYIFRDRFGIKPLYYINSKNRFLASSEINSLLPFLDKVEIFKPVVKDFILDGNIDHSSNTFFNNIHQLRSGSYIKLELNSQKININKWYEPGFSCPASKLSFDDATENLEIILKEILEQNYISDVPLAINLSEGIDSTLLSFLSELTNQNPYAYSMKYGLEELDEYYKLQSINFNREFIEYDYLSFLEHAKDVIRHQGQPFTGMFTVAYSILYQTSKAAGYKVHLDGNGIDEIFLGYDKYLRKNSKTFNKSLSGEIYQNYDFYNKDLINSPNSLTIKNIISNLPSGISEKRKAAFIDLFYLKIPRVLRFNDCVSMQHSCELRVPFLDHRLLDFSNTLPTDYLISDTKGMGKLIIRNILKKHFGEKFSFSKKRYIQTNQTNLLLKEMNNLLRNTLLSDRFFSRNIVDPYKFKTHINRLNEKNLKNSYYLWRLLSYEWWCQQFID